MRNYIFLICIVLVFSCKKENTDNPLLKSLKSDHPAIKTVMDNLENHEVQIQLTDVKSDTTYKFQVDANNYFYPASTVKFPIALLALEKVNTFDSITSDTPFLIEGDSIYTSIRECVTKIFAVSDNKAYNNLYEFLGRDYINKKLIEKGFNTVQISHRLSIADASNPRTKSITFKINDSTFIKQESILDSEIKALELNRIKKGIGYFKDGDLVNEPMNFSKKNYLPISSLHDMMKRIQFPNNYDNKEQFNLNEKDYKFLLSTMKIVPREVGYNEADYYDGYVKFFMLGDSKKRIPDNLEVSNKVGYAYGYLTDCAYIEDTKHHISFFLTATIHVNKDGIFNDDVYEYQDIGIPFLAELGRQIHAYYLEKDKAYFSSLKF